MIQLADAALDQLGPIDSVVANAGLYSFGLTWELTEEQWDDRRKGKIICIASTSSFKGLYGLGHYTAAKHGVLGLVKTLAIELAPHNINVNAICPTTVDTGIINNQAFYDYFAGGPGQNATREYVISHMNNMNLLPDRGC